MKHWKTGIILICFLTMFSACDCVYKVSGIVLDKSTGKPIDSIAIGKTDTTDLDNPFNRKTYTDEKGEYDISGVSGKCDRVTLYFTNDNYLTQKITFKNGSHDSIYLEPIKKLIFNPNQPFDISEIKKTDSFPSSMKDTEVCKEWNLNEKEIRKIITESKPINGSEWHYLFGHYPCKIDVKLTQNENEFNALINAGAWIFIRSNDTTQMFGNFKKENEKYFLDKAWEEEPE